MKNKHKDCNECIHCIATPVEPPCLDWQYCMNNNFCYFEPNFLSKIKNVFGKKQR